MLDSKRTVAEAKALDQLIKKQAQHDDLAIYKQRALMMMAGMLTETLLDYEEPDSVMEQSFHRIADMMEMNPADGDIDMAEFPIASDIDKYTEMGREMARDSAERLPGEMDNVHEITIALIIDSIPSWDQESQKGHEDFRQLIEFVILALSYEMAVQDLCDLVIDNYIASDWKVPQALYTLSALAGQYLKRHCYQMGASLEDEAGYLFSVMADETARHGVTGTKNWQGLENANDFSDPKLPERLAVLREDADKFFDMVGLEEEMQKAVSIAKTTGRMVAVTSLDDAHIQGPVAKSIAKTGLMQGAHIQEDAPQK